MVREFEADYRSGVVTLSSIALLQERFRQLEKMKELRQEKALLKMLSESDHRYSPPKIHYEPPHSTTTLLSSELMFLSPTKPHCQLSLSLRPEGTSTGINESAPSINLAKPWFVDAPSLVNINCASPIQKITGTTFDHSDVDTSLHL